MGEVSMPGQILGKFTRDPRWSYARRNGIAQQADRRFLTEFLGFVIANAHTLGRPQKGKGIKGMKVCKTRILESRQEIVAKLLAIMEGEQMHIAQEQLERLRRFRLLPEVKEAHPTAIEDYAENTT